MAIFRAEMKRRARYILLWTAIVAASAFCLIPVYYRLIRSAGASGSALYETLGSSDFFRSVGMSMHYIFTPLGIYAFLTSFMAIAAGIFGMHLGMSILTKECTEGTAEYLLTKPHTRREIFLAKALTILCGALVLGGAYALASWASLALFQPGFDGREFVLLACSLCLVTLFFAAMGLLSGALFPACRSPLLAAGLVILTAYCITSFSRVVGSRVIGYLSPFSYFNASVMAQTGFYETDYLAVYAVLLTAFLAAAYRIFLKKDVRLRA